MVHNNPTPDIVQAQLDGNRTYRALAASPGPGNTALHRQLIDLSLRLHRDVPRTRLADLRRQAEGPS